MENDMENSRINVLINLSSRLLCESLQGLMKQDTTTYRTMIAHDPEDKEGLAPHKILVDAATLEHVYPTHWSGAKVILIDTGLSEAELLRLLFQYRLDGVISTGTGADLFWKALEAIRAGQVWIDHGKIRAVLHSRASAGHASQESYSKREREIVLSIAEGCTNRQIAAQLNISEQTVKTHVSRILKKANVISRAQLGPVALKFKLQSIPLLRG